MKMEMEHGVYCALPRLGFEMYISLIQVLAITQNTSNQSNSFLAAVRLIKNFFHKRKIYCLKVMQNNVSATIVESR